MNNRLQNRQNCCRETGNTTCGESISYDQLQRMPLAMAYVPWQQWQNVYECSKGLEHGSIFEELILPFHHASRVCRNMHECRTNERMDYRNEQERFCQRERTNNCKERESQYQNMEHCEQRESCRNANRMERTQSCERMQHCGRRCD